MKCAINLNMKFTNSPAPIKKLNKKIAWQYKHPNRIFKSTYTEVKNTSNIKNVAKCCITYNIFLHDL